MEIFTKRLNELIKEHGITKYRLAKDIKVNSQTISFWCSGTNEPKICYLKELCTYFNVSADYMIGLSDDE